MSHFNFSATVQVRAENQRTPAELMLHRHCLTLKKQSKLHVLWNPEVQYRIHNDFPIITVNSGIFNI